MTFAERPPEEPEFAGLSDLVKTLTPPEGFRLVRQISSGAFGAVFEVLDGSSRPFAIKKTLLDPQIKNRELDILSHILHPNCLRMHHSYVKREGTKNNQYLHIICDLFPTDLSKSIASRSLSPDLRLIFSYQILRGLAYLHNIEICHRDIKPSNILINPGTGQLQIADFGSAKRIINEPNKSYIATRPYRAPELLYSAEQYSFPVDVWAAGCVMAEMLIGTGPIFNGDSSQDVVRKIAEVIGSAPQAALAEYGYPNAKVEATEGKGLDTIFPPETPLDLLDLLNRIFAWSPSNRIKAEECLNHPYFDPIRARTLRLPDGSLFELEPDF
jgi:glycogen synthase kinase 3 beta